MDKEKMKNANKMMRISDLNDDKLAYSVITNSQDQNNKENINNFNISNKKANKEKDF